jgi:hypothetical protein
MNIEARQLVGEQKSRTAIIDVDIHPKSSAEDLRPFLSQRWWEHLQAYGARNRQGFAKGFPYPKSQPLASISAASSSRSPIVVRTAAAASRTASRPASSNPRFPGSTAIPDRARW